MEDKPWKNPNDKNLFWQVWKYKLLKTNGEDFSGNVLPSPKAGGAEGGSKGLLRWNFMKLSRQLGVLSF